MVRYSGRSCLMAKINVHHICYSPAWKVELTGQMHRLITTIQNTNASDEQYARITNFVHSLMFEWNRIRCELDSGCKMPKQKRVKVEKPKKRKVKECIVRKKKE